MEALVVGILVALLVVVLLLLVVLVVVVMQPVVVVLQVLVVQVVVVMLVVEVVVIVVVLVVQIVMVVQVVLLMMQVVLVMIYVVLLVVQAGVEMLDAVLVLLVLVEVMDVVLQLAMLGALVVMTEGLGTMKCGLLVLQGLLVVTNGVVMVWNCYPPPREMVDSIQSQIWKFVWSKKPELVRRETCMSNCDHGGLRVIHLEIKSKALLIGRIFRFLDVNQEACPWQVLMRYYVARPLGINDNMNPNCDIPSPFYSHLLRVLKEFSVDLSQPQPSKFYYTRRLQNCVSPVQTRSEAKCIGIGGLILE
jgi:hypothetical protein